MKQSLYLLLSLSILSCNNNAEPTAQAPKDSVIVNNKTSTDTSASTAKQASLTTIHDYPDFEGPDLGEVMKDYLNTYTDVISFDSSFTRNKDLLSVSLKHYCLMDSAVVVPRLYVAPYDLDSFVTHNFETALVIIKNSDTVFNDKIRKTRFKSVVEEEMMKYGTFVWRPSFQLNEKNISIGYNLVVPLTDVGSGVSITVGFDGKVVVQE